MLRSHYIIVAVVVVLSTQVVSFTLPSYITRCSIKDPEIGKCIVKRGNEAIPHIAKGEKQFNIPPMNPYKRPFLQAINSPSVNLNFTDIELHGVKNMRMRNVSVSPIESGMYIKANIYANNLTIICNYRMDGHFSITSIQGEGPARIEFVGVDFNYSYHTIPFKKGDRWFTKIVNDSIEFEIRDAAFHFDQLFNGDKILGDQFNNLLNSKSKDVLKEIKPFVGSTLYLLIHKLSTNFFESFTLGELFN